MKKIAVIRNNLLPISETFIKEQLLALSNWKGVLVGGSFVKNGLDLSGIDTITYGNKNLSLIKKQVTRIKRLFWLPEFEITRALKKINPDIIHVHFATDGVRYWPSINRLGKPIVITLHGFDITIYKEFWEKKKNPIMRLYPRRLLKLSQNKNIHFIAVSNAIKQRAIEYGIPEQKINVQYIGIDVNKFKQSFIPITSRENTILFVGRLTEKKGIIYLLEAFKKVAKNIPNVQLIIAGDGKQFKLASSFVSKHQLNVRFLGAISHERVKKEMSLAKIFCLPSICAENGDREGFGMVILEAQSCGTPVLTSAFGGATEGIINGKTGYSFVEKDVESLAHYIEILLKDDNKAQSMANNGVAFVREKFNIKKCTEDLEKLYNNFVNVEL